jgi:hypothetical protein
MDGVPASYPFSLMLQALNNVQPTVCQTKVWGKLPQAGTTSGSLGVQPVP